MSESEPIVIDELEVVEDEQSTTIRSSEDVSNIEEDCKKVIKIDRQLEQFVKSGNSRKALERICDQFENGMICGNFACGGILSESMNLPGLNVFNSDVTLNVSLPITAQHNKELEQYKRSDDERGQYSNFSVMNKMWLQRLEKFVESQVGKRLGVEDSIHLRINQQRLLILDEGSSYSGRIEPFEGCFALFVVQLPSDFEGDDISVEYNGNTEKFKCSKDSTFQSYFFAFHESAECKIPIVKRGIRSFIVYGIEYYGFYPNISDNSMFLNNFKFIFDNWNKKEFLMRTMSNEYKGNELNYENLKGTDKNLVEGLNQYIEKFHNIGIFLVKIEEKTEDSDDRYSGSDTEYFITSAVGKGKISTCKFQVSEEYISPEDVFDDVKSVKVKPEYGESETCKELWAILIYPIEMFGELSLKLGRNIALEYLASLWNGYSFDSKISTNKIIKFIGKFIETYGEIDVSYLISLDNGNLVRKYISRNKPINIPIPDLIRLIEEFGLDDLLPHVKDYLRKVDIDYILNFLIAFNMQDHAIPIIKEMISQITRKYPQPVVLNLQMLIACLDRHRFLLSDDLKRSILKIIRIDIEKLIQIGKEYDKLWLFEALRRCWTDISQNIEKALESIIAIGFDSLDCQQFIIDLIGNMELMKVETIQLFSNYEAQDEKSEQILQFILNQSFGKLLQNIPCGVEVLFSLFELCFSSNRSRGMLKELISAITVDGFGNGSLKTSSCSWNLSDSVNIPLGGKSHYHHIISPLLLKIGNDHEKIKETNIQGLLGMCIDYYNGVIGGTQEAPCPIHWNIGAKVSCSCRDCTYMLDFTNSPSTLSKTMSMNQAERNHIKKIFQNFKCISYSDGHYSLNVKKLLHSHEMKQIAIEECKSSKKKLEELLNTTETNKRESCTISHDFEPPTKKVKM